MVIALLTIPAAVAGQLAKRLWLMMVLAIFLCMVFTWSGLAISYSYNLSSGPTIILVAGVTYMVVLLGTQMLKKGKR